MEIFGGVMVMLWMIGFFLTIIWFILPFVIFSMKGRVEQSHLLLTEINARLSRIETEMARSATTCFISPATTAPISEGQPTPIGQDFHTP